MNCCFIKPLHVNLWTTRYCRTTTPSPSPQQLPSVFLRSFSERHKLNNFNTALSYDHKTNRCSERRMAYSTLTVQHLRGSDWLLTNWYFDWSGQTPRQESSLVWWVFVQPLPGLLLLLPLLRGPNTGVQRLTLISDTKAWKNMSNKYVITGRKNILYRVARCHHGLLTTKRGNTRENISAQRPAAAGGRCDRLHEPHDANRL